MSPVNPSAPDVPPRRARARATQWQIVKAAFALFCERGYIGTTMAQIAEAAGVAVQTVYFTFHTKAAVLSRAYDYAVSGEGEPILPWEQPWYREMVAAADVVESLGQLVSGWARSPAGLRPCMSWLQALPRATRRSLRWSIATSGGASRGTGAWSRCCGPNQH